LGSPIVFRPLLPLVVTTVSHVVAGPDQKIPDNAGEFMAQPVALRATNPTDVRGEYPPNLALSKTITPA
jgi:hypothetical protein